MGRELREELERFRAEVQKRDMDAVGSHLEERFKDLQAGLEQRLSQAGDAADGRRGGRLGGRGVGRRRCAPRPQDLVEEQAPA